ncbi:hypothetical protein CW755_03405 [Geobacillus thermodenitrificans]|nr:hypothetical protein [Geobacillus sp. MR]OQP07383.1 hypothetical protein B1691_16835 [Geobacillus sp. 47C-IIb]PTR48355.1 hypothetical protein CW755_03405 [Geobacillus thermodenitrificans]
MLSLNILVGVTGSSGVVELPMYLRVFREKLDANIRLVCTSNVQKFIDVNFLAAHADAPAYQDMYDFPKEYTRNRVPHSFLHDWADIFIILPCTANTLAKCANGIADNLLTMLVLCSPRPVVFFPNMGPNMWDAKVTQYNAKKLISFGHKVVFPSGNAWITATGEKVDYGHVPPPYTVAEYIQRHIQQSDNELKGAFLLEVFSGT